eukprot:CAMPEP_0115187072 /NCGR_PEP_ID=MMETSP0270-20121206/10307_1 /TAXON_ID=71861 /ORGANISM="Scrippsiella trochoidea, Strain CCMP3099" /LENGTH=452 /DNA_ID=CAMNT_0002600213 /DNA_START=45 /DNA_END=1399 /DNA_ORIENTATION=-
MEKPAAPAPSHSASLEDTVAVKVERLAVGTKEAPSCRFAAAKGVGAKSGSGDEGRGRPGRYLDVALTVGLFLACFSGIGLWYSIGMWVPSLLDEFGGSHVETQVVPSMLSAGYFFGGIAARKVIRVLGFRAAYIFGGTLAVGTILACSFAHHLFVFYSFIFVGIGFQSAWMAAGALIPLHLPKRKSTQLIAIAVTGSGFGSLVFSNTAQVAIPLLGLRGALRLVAAVLATLYALGAMALSPPPVETLQESGERKTSSLLGNVGFCLHCLALALSTFGWIMVLAALGTHASLLGHGPDIVARLYSVFGVAGIIGRFLTALLARWQDPLVLYAACLFGVSASITVLGTSEAAAPMLVGTAVLGLMGGPIVGLVIPTLHELVGAEQLPEALAALTFLQGTAALLAPAVGGWLADAAGNYTEGLLLSASLCLVSACVDSRVAMRARRRPNHSGGPA